MAGFWRLELLAGHVDMRLALLCATESAQLLIVPGALSLASPGYRWTPMAGIPAVCVVQDTEPCGEQAILHARADARSQLDAHVAAIFLCKGQKLLADRVNIFLYLRIIYIFI